LKCDDGWRGDIGPFAIYLFESVADSNAVETAYDHDFDVAVSQLLGEVGDGHAFAVYACI